MSMFRARQVEKALKAIRDIHQRGLPLREGIGGQVPSVAEEARRRGEKIETLRQARRFAMAYTPRELDGLCKLIEKVQTSQPQTLSVVGPTHVIRLLSVPSERRTEFLELAATNGWSLGDLERAIKAEFGARRQGGRLRRIPTALPAFLADVDRRCESWRRWWVRLRPSKDTVAGHVTLPDLPRPVRGRLVAASKAVLALQDAMHKVAK
jgi:hypothetical protein